MTVSKPTGTESDVYPITLKYAAPAKPSVTAESSTDNEGGLQGKWFTLEIPDMAWDEDACPRQLHLPEADFEAIGGNQLGQNLVLRGHLRPFWEAKLQSDVDGSSHINFEPQHIASAPKTVAVLERVERTQPAGEPSAGTVYRFILDKATTFTWSSDQGKLVMEFPAAQLSSVAVNPPDGCRVTSIKTSRYNLLRFETKLETGQSFDFSEAKEPAHTLVLRVGAQEKDKKIDAVGIASTDGYLGGATSGTVVIDPGHGGGDSGCQNRGLGVYEKNITLDISLRLAKTLQQRGWKVVMTRNDDRDVTYAGSPDLMELEARANVANQIHADVFVSIHCNASVSSGARGSSVYYYKDEDYALAQSLDVLGSAVGFDELGVIQNRFAVLRLTTMPAALVETAFLTNPSEGSRLADDGVRQSIAERLAQGLERYMAGRKNATNR